MLLAAAEHEVRQRARDERRIGFDERDVDRAVAPHADVFRRGRAAVAAADDDDLARRAAARSSRSRRASAAALPQPAADGLQEIAPLHVHGRSRSLCRLLRREPAGDELDLLVGVALGELRHDRARRCAPDLNSCILRDRGRLRHAGERGRCRPGSRRWCRGSWRRSRRVAGEIGIRVCARRAARPAPSARPMPMCNMRMMDPPRCDAATTRERAAMPYDDAASWRTTAIGSLRSPRRMHRRTAHATRCRSHFASDARRACRHCRIGIRFQSTAVDGGTRRLAARSNRVISMS